MRVATCIPLARAEWREGVRGCSPTSRDVAVPGRLSAPTRDPPHRQRVATASRTRVFRNDAFRAYESEVEMVRAGVVRSRVKLGFCFVALLAPGLGGCADLSFKPGASPGDMQRDELACRETAGGETAYMSCMKSRGYLISQAVDGIDWTAASR